MFFTGQTVFVRSTQGVAEMDNETSMLPRTERLLLIMFNGSATVAEISARLYSVPLKRFTQAINELLNRGFIENAVNDAEGQTPVNGLHRQKIENFLKVDELDPTTAMIARFELEAALNESVQAQTTPQTIKTDFVKKDTTGHIKQAMETVVQSNKDEEAKSTNQQTSAPILIETPKTDGLHHTQHKAISTQKRNEPSLKRVKRKKNPPKTSSWTWLVLGACVWFGVIYFIRTK